MKKLRSMLAALIVTVLASAFILPLAACGASHTVHITSAGGIDMANITVEIYDGDKLVDKKTTGEDGKASFNIGAGSYSIKLSGLPAGYYLDKDYKIEGNEETVIRVPSKVIDGTPTRQYVIGDVMYDFEQTVYTYNPDSAEKYTSKTVKLSEVLQEKKAVVINFWYSTCSWCAREYPAMKAAYEQYSDKIEIFGINDYPDANESGSEQTAINQTIKDEVPYLMCRDAAGVGIWFTKSGWPFSVIVDRYGVVCETTSTQISQKYWEDKFAMYTSDDYAPGYTPGTPGGGDENPDKPEDFNARMPETQLISRAINKTEKAVLFSEDVTTNLDGSKAAWPWALTEDKTAIYPTNSGHWGTVCIIYAEVEIDQDKVLAFDYSLATDSELDNLYVAVDARDGIGKQVMMVSGKQNWTTGYAYVALEKGTHEIAFTYAQSTESKDYSARTCIKNLRFITIDEMNADLVAKNTSFELTYPAVRQYFDEDIKNYNSFEDVYFAADGYYHVGYKDDGSACGTDPYLLADLTHSTPFFTDAQTSLYTVFSNYKNNGGFRINGVDYTDKFDSYVSYSSNSDYNGMVPVTVELKNILDLYFKSQIAVTSPYYHEDGWLMFCVSNRTYGLQPESLKDPIEGLAYFSAYTAKETTGIADTDTAKLNSATFNTVIMPKGLLYKFTPTESAVYRFHSLDVEIVEGYPEHIDAYLYDGTLNNAPHLTTALVQSDSSRFYRYGGENNFDIYYYLTAGEDYYISVAFSTVEVLGTFHFRIDKIGETYSYLHTATAEAYSGDVSNLPTFANVKYDSVNDKYYDTKSNEAVYCDFTEVNFLFGGAPIEYILNSNKTNPDKKAFFDFSDDNGNPIEVTLDGVKYIGGDFTDDLLGYLRQYAPYNATLTSTYKNKQLELNLTKNYITANYDGFETKFSFAALSSSAIESEKGQTVTLSFGKDKYDDNGKLIATADKISVTLKLEGNTLTVSSGDTALGSTSYTHQEDNELYGMVPVDQKIHTVLQLTNALNRGYSNPNEWLMACWYRVNVGPEA